MKKPIEYLLNNYSQGEILYAIRKKVCCFQSDSLLRLSGDSSDLEAIDELDSFKPEVLKSAYYQGETTNFKPGLFSIETDDRFDYFELSNNGIQNNAKWSVAFIKDEFLIDYSEDSFLIQDLPMTVGEGVKLCHCEKFLGQPMVVNRSGVAVGENLILTAAHVKFDNIDFIKKHKVVFGFQKVDKSQTSYLVDKSLVYDIDKIHDLHVNDDYVVIKVLGDFSHLKGSYPAVSSPSISEPVYAIGYPGTYDDNGFGIPMKFSLNATIKPNSDFSKNYFFADLDVFQHNSGSPVFSSKNHTLLGIVTDVIHTQFQFCGTCNLTSIRYSQFPRVQIVPQIK